LNAGTCGDQRQHVAQSDRLALLRVQAVAGAVRILVLHERGAIGGVVERIAHAVQRIALAGLVTVEDRGAFDGLFLDGHRHGGSPGG
jgi:hypothetical protein